MKSYIQMDYDRYCDLKEDYFVNGFEKQMLRYAEERKSRILDWCLYLSPILFFIATILGVVLQ